MSIVSAPVSFIIGKGHPDFDLSPAEVREILSEALSTISPASFVLTIVADKAPDDNRDLLFPLAAQILADRKIAKLDPLVAQGTHAPMSERDKRTKIGAAGTTQIPGLGHILTCPRFCTSGSERVCITAWGLEVTLCPAIIPTCFATAFLTHISILNSTYESSDVRRHRYSCWFEYNEDTPEDDPPLREKQNGPFQLSFNASLKIDFQRSRVTSDGDLIVVRELDERLSLGDLIVQPAAAGQTHAAARIHSFHWPIPQSGTCNVHSADDWEELLLPEIERQQKLGREVVFRADAAFAKPEIYEALEERGVKYAIRIAANDGLERDIAELLMRPVGRPSQSPTGRLHSEVVGCKLPVSRKLKTENPVKDSGGRQNKRFRGCGGRPVWKPCREGSRGRRSGVYS